MLLRTREQGSVIKADGPSGRNDRHGLPTLFFVTHPDVVVDPRVPVERWHLSPFGIARMRHFSVLPMLSAVELIWSSAETKAIEAAGILAGALGHQARESRLPLMTLEWLIEGSLDWAPPLTRKRVTPDRTVCHERKVACGAASGLIA